MGGEVTTLEWHALVYVLSTPHTNIADFVRKIIARGVEDGGGSKSVKLSFNITMYRHLFAQAAHFM